MAKKKQSAEQIINKLRVGIYPQVCGHVVNWPRRSIAHSVGRECVFRRNAPSEVIDRGAEDVAVGG